MKKELIWKTIWELQKMSSNLLTSKNLLIQDISELKKDKNNLNSEISIINKNIDNWNKNNTEAENKYIDLIWKNTDLQAKVTQWEYNLAALYTKEQEITKNFQLNQENLNNHSITLNNLIKDIQDLKEEKTSVSNTNIAIIQDNIKKNQESEKIQLEITERSNILNDINKSIAKINNIKKNLEEKETYLIKKASKLVRKESRLNDLKKDLFSNK